jgi:hypothetical protein
VVRHVRHIVNNSYFAWGAVNLVLMATGAAAPELSIGAIGGERGRALV